MRRKQNTCIIMATMTGGEQHEHGEDQWEYQDEQWYDEKAEETYAIEEEYQDPLYDQDQDEDGEYNLEEDDQDNYE